MQPTLPLCDDSAHRGSDGGESPAPLEGGVQTAPERDFGAISSKDVTRVLDNSSTERVGDPLDLQPRLVATEFKQLCLGSGKADGLKGLKSTSGPFAVGVFKDKVERAAKIVFYQARKSPGGKPGLFDRYWLVIRETESIDAIAHRVRGYLESFCEFIVGWLFHRSEHASSRTQTIVLQLLREACDSTQIAGNLWTLNKGAATPPYRLGDQASALKSYQRMPEGHTRDTKVQSEFTLSWQAIATFELPTRDSLKEQQFDLLVGRNR